MAAVIVKVRAGGIQFVIDCGDGESILQALIRQKITASAVCGGAGLCGKCRIRLRKGELEVTAADMRFFTKEEIEKGCRLSCKAYPSTNCAVELYYGQENEFDVVGGYVAHDGREQPETGPASDIAVDLGTTTIAMSLGNNIYTSINRQRTFGADVITRIHASNQGLGAALREAVQESLAEGIRCLATKEQVNLSGIQRAAIAGNTTMIHLLMGYPCETLGVAPFTPVGTGAIGADNRDVFGISQMGGRAVILPGISAFVGADIVSGLYACGFDHLERPSLFIDLGTNGEMAVGQKDRLLCASTAAGPAFEGGNIRFGTGSIAGAICHAGFTAGRMEIETIGAKPPVGICGTGVVEITAALLQEGILDETGRLDERYAEEGYPVAAGIVFTQKDVREIQLAKAAVRAGMETLLLRYGIGYEEIETVYLAGGFGYHMNVGKAAAIGLLPEELAAKVRPVGNSSLEGARLYLSRTDGNKEGETGTEDVNQCGCIITARLAEIAVEVPLGGDRDFNNLYMEYMMFE